MSKPKLAVRLGFVLGGLLACSVANASSMNGARICQLVSGPFDAVSPPDCTSPVGICTLGQLRGNFPSTYSFRAETLFPSADPATPNKFLYSGHSVITRNLYWEPFASDAVALDPSVTDTSSLPGRIIPSQLFGNDSGQMLIQNDGTANFVTTVSIAGGTGTYFHASGQIIATGVLNLATGATTGSYSGVVCRPWAWTDDTTVDPGTATLN